MNKVYSTTQLVHLYKESCRRMGVGMGHLIAAAALGFVNLFGQLYKGTGRIYLFAGPDLNGAIALAVARLLTDRHYRLKVFLFHGQGYTAETEAELAQTQAAGVEVYEVSRQFNPPVITEQDIIIDGLFGPELLQSLEGGFERLVQWINSLGREVISIDLPSGLFSDDNSLTKGKAIIKAKHTITFERPKLVMLFGDYTDYIGSWHLVPLGIPSEVHQHLPSTEYYTLNEHLLATVLRHRRPFDQEQDYGKVLMLGDTQSMGGLLSLTAEAILLTGCASLDILTNRSADHLVSALPEVIFMRSEGYDLPKDVKGYNVLSLGHCMSQGALELNHLRDILASYRLPMVLSGEVLRLIGETPSILDHIPEQSILLVTPEHRRTLFGVQYTEQAYLEAAQSYASRHRVMLIMLGGYTSVVASTGKVYFSTEGNSGMKRRGMSELLLGLVSGFVARGYDTPTASLLAVYVWGAAGDNYAGRYTDESLRPSFLLSEIPAVLGQLYR